MRLPRFELGTSTLSVLRSNQLSYNREIRVKKTKDPNVGTQTRTYTGLVMEARRVELLTF